MPPSVGSRTPPGFSGAPARSARRTVRRPSRNAGSGSRRWDSSSGRRFGTPSRLKKADLGGMVGKTYGEKGFTNLHSSEDQPRQASAVLRLLLPEGSRALFPRGLPESEGYAVTPEIILPTQHALPHLRPGRRRRWAGVRGRGGRQAPGEEVPEARVPEAEEAEARPTPVPGTESSGTGRPRPHELPLCRVRQAP